MAQCSGNRDDILKKEFKMHSSVNILVLSSGTGVKLKQASQRKWDSVGSWIMSGMWITGIRECSLEISSMHEAWVTETVVHISYHSPGLPQHLSHIHPEAGTKQVQSLGTMTSVAHLHPGEPHCTWPISEEQLAGASNSLRLCLLQETKQG